MMKKIMCLLLVMLMICSVSGCGSAKKDCAATIEGLETAMNEADIQGILDCINPDKTTMLKIIIDTITDTKDKIVQAIFDFLGMPVISEDDSDDEGMDVISIKPEKYNLKKDSGDVLCTVSIQVGENTIEKKLVFDMIKKSDAWYIDKVRAAKE